MTKKVELQGMASDTVIENVFICDDDSSVIVTLKDEAKCPICKKEMENAGWFEAGIPK